MRTYASTMLLLGLMACSSEMPNPRPRASAIPRTSIPALDAELPAAIQTATFALG
jgi:hypothetical protein